MSTRQFTLLGTGSSGGVPRIGNDWGNCDPSNPRNRRRRCAMLVEQSNADGAKTSILIDAGADMREQMLSADVRNLDAVLLTHSHADHIFGLDDLRQMALSLKRSIDVYMTEETADIVHRSFGYCFQQAPNSSYPAFCNEHRIQHGQSVVINGAGGEVEVFPFLAEHGDIEALGFRIEDVVYLPDAKRLSRKASIEALNNVETLILDALRHKPHPGHLNLEEALEMINRYQPTKAVLTNMHADLDYEQLTGSLPATVEPGYDGMTFKARTRG